MRPFCVVTIRGASLSLGVSLMGCTKASICRLAVLVCLLTAAASTSAAAWEQIRFYGSTTTSFTYSSVFRAANTTSVYLSTAHENWKLTLSGSLVGRNYGLPSNALTIGPVGGYVEKWSANATNGPLTLQFGDASIQSLSSTYISSRALYGGAGVYGTRLGASTNATLSGFIGRNVVSSGLSASSHSVWGGSLELSSGKVMGFTASYLSAERSGTPGTDLGMVGGQVWTAFGPTRVSGEYAVSQDRVTDTIGQRLSLEARMPVLTGILTASSGYTSPQFRSLNQSLQGKPGGVASAQARWQGRLYSQGISSVDLGVDGTYQRDNIDDSLSLTTSKAGLQSTLTLNRIILPVIQAKYGYSVDLSDDEPYRTTNLTRHSASLVASMPLRLGPVGAEVMAQAGRTVSNNHVTGAGSTSDVISISGITSLGKYSVRFKAGQSNFVPRTTGDRKLLTDVTVSLSRPVSGSLSGSLNLGFTDDRKFTLDTGEMKSLTDTVDVALRMNYRPNPRLTTALTYRQKYLLPGGNIADTKLDHWLEGEIAFRF